MNEWLVVLAAITQVVLLLLKSHYSKEDAISQSHADKAKEITDAIASKDLSRINAVVNSLRD